jgi:hypothetical protein
MKNKKTFFSILGVELIIALFILLKVPSLVEPNWYIDEGLYATIAHYLINHVTLYKGVWDNKPPSIYFLFLASRYFFSYQILPLRILIFGLSAGTGILAIMLIKEWFENTKVGFYLLVLLAFVIMNSLFGNQVNGEVIFTFFTALSFFIVRRFHHTENFTPFLVAGFLMGIGISFKITAGLDALAYMMCFQIFATTDYLKSRGWSIYRENLLHLGAYAIMCITPLLLYLAYFVPRNAINDYLNALLFSNTAYVSYFNNTIFGVNTLLINSVVVILVLGILLYLYIAKKTTFFSELNAGSFFIIIWFVFDLYSILISGRAYYHYLLQPIIPASILFAIVLYRVTVKKFILMCVVVFSFLFYFVRNVDLPQSLTHSTEVQINYYGTIYGYLLGNVSQKELNSNFNVSDNGLNVNADNAITSYTNGLLGAGNNKIYMWANMPWVSAATNLTPVCKYIANFYISNDPGLQSETMSCLTKQMPEVIIDENSGYTFKALSTLEQQHYHLARSFFVNTVRVYTLNET